MVSVPVLLFFRSFKKFKGMSPAEYIKEHGIFIK